MTQPATAFFLASALPLLAQQAPIMTLRPTVREVLLDVLVTDSRNHPAKGLKASDFHLTEDGATQTFNHFDEHDAMTPASIPPASGLPPNTFTDFTPVTNTNASTVILLDSLATPIDAQMKSVVTLRKTIAIPAKGSFFLRLGVHDVGSDRMGALEIPVDRIQLGIAGAGQTLNP